MAHELVWSPEALEDVEQIAAFIARDSAWYAQAVVFRVFESAETLVDFPARGRIVPEARRESFREIFVYSYQLIYEVGANRVTILAAAHGHRLLSTLLGRESDGI
jgi:plasmid stabilization system protein ParE